MNIVSGLLAIEAVNVNDAVAFGTEQWNKYEGRWNDDFYSSLTKVVTMAASKRGVTLGSNVIFDT